MLSAVKMYKTFFILLADLFFTDVMSYNPLLTYSVRFKKITSHPNISGQYTIDQIRDEQFINGNFTLYTNENVDSTVVIIYRCKPEGYDCEYFQTWKMIDICPKIIQKNQLWSRWYSSYDPPLVCPFDKVHYKIRNATFDVSKLIALYPEVTNYQWKVIHQLYAGDVFVGSWTLEYFLFGYRKKYRNKLL